MGILAWLFGNGGAPKRRSTPLIVADPEWITQMEPPRPVERRKDSDLDRQLKAVMALCERGLPQAVIPAAELVSQGYTSLADSMTFIGPRECIREIIAWCRDGHPESWGLLADYLKWGSGTVGVRQEQMVTTRTSHFAAFGKEVPGEMRALLQEIACHLSPSNLDNLTRIRDAYTSKQYYDSESSQRQVLVDFSPLRDFAAMELARRKES